MDGMNSEAIFADSRDLAAYAVRVARVPGIGLVMRCDNAIGYLPELMEKKIEPPLIISSRGNNNRLTGFVKIEGGRSHLEHVVGIKGFPFQTKLNAFRALPTPMQVVIVPADTRMEKIQTDARTARAAFRAIEARSDVQKESVIIAAGNDMLVQGWEILLSADNSDMPYFPEEPRKELFSAENMVNAALRQHAKRLDENPIGGDGQQFMLLNKILADEAVGDNSWRDKLLPAYTRRLAGKDAEAIVSRLAQRMREDGWSLTIDMADNTLPLKAIAPDGEIVTSGLRLGSVKDRTYWKELLVELCDGLGFEAQKKLLCQFEPQKALA
ncbi:MAG TPA: hypothetical protein P5080_05675 [Candidatus Paceibacterota bacterium]|nr:hypothetical protein [Candidatus Paceibacterota bacterium]HSA37157.1 hypothetical protein [Candidatus Paceibacterota bacterium]